MNHVAEYMEPDRPDGPTREQRVKTYARMYARLLGRPGRRGSTPKRMPSRPVEGTWRSEVKVIVDDAGNSFPSGRAAADAMGVHHRLMARRVEEGRRIAGRLFSKGPDWGKQRGRHRKGSNS